jgi:hypothetical protein
MHNRVVGKLLKEIRADYVGERVYLQASLLSVMDDVDNWKWILPRRRRVISFAPEDNDGSMLPRNAGCT